MPKHTRVINKKSPYSSSTNDPWDCLCRLGFDCDDDDVCGGCVNFHEIAAVVVEDYFEKLFALFR
jgi:hypothetical protein